AESRNDREYRRFAARLISLNDKHFASELSALPDVPSFFTSASNREPYPVKTEAQSLQLIDAFYAYVEAYPAYQQRGQENVAAQRKCYGSAYPIPYDESRHPDYDYASRHTGLLGHYVRGLEMKYQIACEQPASALGRILTDIRKACKEEVH